MPIDVRNDLISRLLCCDSGQWNFEFQCSISSPEMDKRNMDDGKDGIGHNRKGQDTAVQDTTGTGTTGHKGTGRGCF